MKVFATADVRQKLREIQGACHDALLTTEAVVGLPLARDVEVRASKDLPPKPGFSTPTGRARLLHDLASIELQAMELGLRTLVEYPEAPRAFREELAAVTVQEGEHLELCLNGIEELGHRWGDWPVHTGLWEAVDVGEDLIDRVIIVHRYLEGSGLDAGERLLQRLNGQGHRDVTNAAVERIHREEIGHVDFGSRWYRELCCRRHLDPDADFADRLAKLRTKLPYRTEQLAYGPRLKAGFTENELAILEKWRER